MNLVPVPTIMASQLRPVWEPFLAIVAENGLMTVEAMAKDVEEGLFHVCLAWDDERKEAKGLAGIELRMDAKGQSICDLVWCVGHDMAEWFDLIGDIEAWAKDHLGCARIRAIHRTGWARLLKGKGYRETHRVAEKELA